MSLGPNDRYKKRSKRKSFDTRVSESNTWVHKLKGAMENGGLGDGQIDADYKIFLTYLREDFESALLEDEASDETNARWQEENTGDFANTREREEKSCDGYKEDADPQYKAFLKNLRENGKAYALEVPKDNGGFELVVYEAPKREVEHQSKIKKKLRNFETVNKKNLTSDENGNAYALEVPKDNRGFELVAYEAPEQEVEHHPMIKKKLRNFEKVNEKSLTSGEKIESRYNLRRNARWQDKIEEPKVSGKILGEIRNLLIRNGENIDTKIRLTRKAQTKDKIEQPKVSAKVLGKEGNSVGEKHLRGKSVNSISHGVKGCSTKKRSQEDAHMHETREKREREDSVVDKCYQHFLNGMQMEDGCMVYVLNNGKRFKYEEDNDEDEDESSSDMEIWVNDANDPVPESREGQINPSVTPDVFKSPMEGDDLLWLPNQSNHSQFREKLMEILKKPYDQDEFDELLHEVNERKPMSGDRHLRGRTRTFSKNDEFSKSYLDHHKDLNRELFSVRFERPKMLNILRGFFYWLQNLTQKGSFIPWKDPSCLAVMPGSK